MPVEELSTFLADLEKYQILDSSRLQEARSLSKTVGSAAGPLAAELIRRGRLSSFQVDRLLSGHGQSLVLGTYVLIEMLGEGGMGQVFKARHALMDRLVALKLIRADRLNDPQAMGRFRREMQASAKLTHPNVVLAHDAARVGDVYLLVMEYVEGIDLAQYLKQRGRLPWSEAASHVRQAALGLQHAHECGLVHRDVKPSNLMLAARDGSVKVLDLGLARLRPHVEYGDAESQFTREGSLMGTPDYIAPEQAVDSRAVDIRADIYSLGCTLYHLLAGRPPFPGGSLMEKLIKHQQVEPEPIERLALGLPPELAGVVRRMMAKRPDNRYETPRAVADALAPFVGMPSSVSVTPAVYVAGGDSELTTMPSSVTPLHPLPPPLPGEVKRPRPLRRRALLGLILVVPALIALVVFLARPTKKEQTIAEDKTQKGAEGSTTTEPRETTPKHVPPVDVPIEPAKLPDPLAEGGPRMVKELSGHTGSIVCLAFSPDGKQLASGSDDQRVWLWEVRSGEALGKPLGLGAPVRANAWRPEAQTQARNPLSSCGT
jgi:serine/threonine-protein kinase